MYAEADINSICKKNVDLDGLETARRQIILGIKRQPL